MFMSTSSSGALKTMLQTRFATQESWRFVDTILIHPFPNLPYSRSESNHWWTLIVFFTISIVQIIPWLSHSSSSYTFSCWIHNRILATLQNRLRHNAARVGRWFESIRESLETIYFYILWLDLEFWEWFL